MQSKPISSTLAKLFLMTTARRNIATAFRSTYHIFPYPAQYKGPNKNAKKLKPLGFGIIAPSHVFIKPSGISLLFAWF